MQRRADIARFVVSFIVVSAALGWVFWSSGALVGTYSLDVSMLAVPVVSAMLASVGFAWSRKLAYASITAGLYLVTGAAAELSGLHDLARRQLGGGASLPSVGVTLYMAFLMTFPFVMLVLFVGRTPQLLWSRQPD